MTNRYVVIVEGTNVYLKRNEIRRMGFYTTRGVEAANRDEAGKIAIELVKEELAEHTMLCNLPEDPPVFLIEKIEEVDSFEGIPTKGFSLYEDRRDT